MVFGSDSGGGSGIGWGAGLDGPSIIFRPSEGLGFCLGYG